MITTGLTEKEIKVLKASRITDFGDAAEKYGTWSFAVQDGCGLPKRSYGGVVSSLVKKGYVSIFDSEGKRQYRDMVFTLTDTGRALFSDELPENKG